MSEVLAGRVAIVTGGGRGIGLAIAEALAGAGASVLLADNGTGIDGNGADPLIARAAAAKIGARALPWSESVASPGAAKALAELALRRLGGIDILVNNAAILRDALVFKGEPRDWDAVVHTNLGAAYYLINAVSPQLREQHKQGRPNTGQGYRWGRIVNVGSTAGFYGNYGQAAYAAAKAGLFALTRVAAMELSRSDVTVNLVVPFARTRVTDTIKPANPAQAAYKERAVKVSPRHVADLVLALCGEAGAGVTGQAIGVRGRELFLFSQPRPAARLTIEARDWSPERIAAALTGEFGPALTDLSTDLEHFNTEPLI